MIVGVVMGKCASHCGGVFICVFMCIYMSLMRNAAGLVQAHICMAESAHLLASWNPRSVIGRHMTQSFSAWVAHNTCGLQHTWTCVDLPQGDVCWYAPDSEWVTCFGEGWSCTSEVKGCCEWVTLALQDSPTIPPLSITLHLTLTWMLHNDVLIEMISDIPMFSWNLYHWITWRCSRGQT